MQVSYMTMTIWINDFLSANNICLDVVSAAGNCQLPDVIPRYVTYYK